MDAEDAIQLIDEIKEQDGSFLIHEEYKSTIIDALESYFEYEILQYGFQVKQERRIKEYLKKHKASDIKVGDYVKVSFKPENIWGLKWDNIWVPAMDKMVGKVLKVIDDNEERGFNLIDNDGISFNFPCNVLLKER